MNRPSVIGWGKTSIRKWYQRKQSPFNYNGDIQKVNHQGICVSGILCDTDTIEKVWKTGILHGLGVCFSMIAIRFSSFQLGFSTVISCCTRTLTYHWPHYPPLIFKLLLDLQGLSYDVVQLRDYLGFVYNIAQILHLSRRTIT